MHWVLLVRASCCILGVEIINTTYLSDYFFFLLIFNLLKPLQIYCVRMFQIG